VVEETGGLVFQTGHEEIEEPVIIVIDPRTTNGSLAVFGDRSARDLSKSAIAIIMVKKIAFVGLVGDE
jgi:hypothetical protein